MGVNVTKWTLYMGTVGYIYKLSDLQKDTIIEKFYSAHDALVCELCFSARVCVHACVSVYECEHF